ncbi:caspase-10-like [Hyalella azteca]|uniref:Caspase-10-like n=1 Tax=Hyalella azteca TaxID=294128 RepID=A0A8B7PLY8_HYAAZ|nr:caspase-10-like [Hyalella azteca]
MEIEGSQERKEDTPFPSPPLKGFDGVGGATRTSEEGFENVKETAPVPITEDLKPTASESEREQAEHSINVRRGDGTNSREEGHYPVEGQKKLCIFNFENFKKSGARKGSEEDVRKLTSTFQQVGYEVELYEDQNKSEFLATLLKISKNEELARNKLFILAIMSHGRRSNGLQFVAADDRSISIDEVRSYFNDRHCPQLKGKPKIFLAAFCRPLPEILQSSSETSIAEADEPQGELVEIDVPPAGTFQLDSQDQPNVTSESGEFETEATNKNLEQVKHLLRCTEEDLTPDQIEEILAMLDPESVDLLLQAAASGCEITSVVSVDNLNAEPQTQSNCGEQTLHKNYPKDFNDMMTLYSCKTGFRSSRNRRVGTRFISALCDAVAENGYRYNVDRLYADIEERMRVDCPDDSESLETFDPDKESSTFKTCYLF